MPYDSNNLDKKKAKKTKKKRAEPQRKLMEDSPAKKTNIIDHQLKSDQKEGTGKPLSTDSVSVNNLNKLERALDILQNRILDMDDELTK